MDLKQLYCKRCGYVQAELFAGDKCPICGSEYSPHPYLFDDWMHTFNDIERESWLSKNIIQDDQTAYYIKKRILWEQQKNTEINEQWKNRDPKPTNIPHCPICGSADLKKLSTVGKAAKIGLFGIFGAGSLGKTYNEVYPLSRTTLNFRGAF